MFSNQLVSGFEARPRLPLQLLASLVGDRNGSGQPLSRRHCSVAQVVSASLKQLLSIVNDRL